MKQVKLKLSGLSDFVTQEAYKVLRTNLQFCGQDIKTIAITSCNENEGKSTISLHLAKSFSDLGKRVLVIDADMRKSVLVGRNTDANNPSGLSEVLSGLKTVDECIYGTQYENLHLIFAGQYPPNPAELLNNECFIGLLAKAKKMYDYIIVDTPPLGAVIDAAIVASKSDGTVLVMGDGKVRYHQAKNVLEQLKKSECRVLGVVRNQTHLHSKNYYSKKSYYLKHRK